MNQLLEQYLSVWNDIRINTLQQNHTEDNDDIIVTIMIRY